MYFLGSRLESRSLSCSTTRSFLRSRVSSTISKSICLPRCHVPYCSSFPSIWLVNVVRLYFVRSGKLGFLVTQPEMPNSDERFSLSASMTKTAGQEASSEESLERVEFGSRANDVAHPRFRFPFVDLVRCKNQKLRTSFSDYHVSTHLFYVLSTLQ